MLTETSCCSNDEDGLPNDESTSQQSISVLSPKKITYKLVGDNIDKNITPRDMRSDHQTRSFHFFHTYAVRDRIDLSGFSESCEKAEVFIADKLLPSQNDKKEIIENYT